MPDEQIEAQIEQADREVEAQKSKLDELGAAYVQQAKMHLPGFFRDWIDRIVKAKVEVAERLGVDGLRGMKQEFNEFIGRIPSLVDEAMPKADEWWHRGTLPDDPYPQSHDVLTRRGDGIERRLRAVLKPFGAILVRHGFAEIGHQKDWEGPLEGPSYKYGIGLPEPINQALGQYATAFRTLVEKNMRFTGLLKQRRERDAKNLWDQA